MEQFLTKVANGTTFFFLFSFSLSLFKKKNKKKKHEASLLERFREKKGFVPGNFCEKCDLLVGKLPLIWEG